LRDGDGIVRLANQNMIKTPTLSQLAIAIV
jgi:hypothetical protein